MGNHVNNNNDNNADRSIQGNKNHNTFSVFNFKALYSTKLSPLCNEKNLKRIFIFGVFVTVSYVGITVAYKHAQQQKLIEYFRDQRRFIYVSPSSAALKRSSKRASSATVSPSPPPPPTVRFMSYNILADGYMYALSERHDYLPIKYRVWKYRMPRIMAQVKAYQPGIIAIQESSYDTFYNGHGSLQHQFSLIGYTGIHVTRDQYGHRLGYSAQTDCIFYNAKKFELIQKAVVRLNEISKLSIYDKYFGSDKNSRFRGKLSECPDVLIVLHMRFKGAAHNGSNAIHGREFIVTSSHLYYNPEQPHIKTAQALIFNQALTDVISKDWLLDINEIPIVLGIDANSLPFKQKADQFDPNLDKYMGGGHNSSRGANAVDTVEEEDEEQAVVEAESAATESKEEEAVLSRIEIDAGNRDGSKASSPPMSRGLSLEQCAVDSNNPEQNEQNEQSHHTTNAKDTLFVSGVYQLMTQWFLPSSHYHHPKTRIFERAYHSIYYRQKNEARVSAFLQTPYAMTPARMGDSQFDFGLESESESESKSKSKLLSSSDNHNDNTDHNEHGVRGVNDHDNDNDNDSDNRVDYDNINRKKVMEGFSFMHPSRMHFNQHSTNWLKSVRNLFEYSWWSWWYHARRRQKYQLKAFRHKQAHPEGPRDHGQHGSTGHSREQSRSRTRELNNNVNKIGKYYGDSDSGLLRVNKDKELTEKQSINVAALARNEVDREKWPILREIDSVADICDYEIDIHWKSVYATVGKEPVYTNRTPSFSGCIDYIFINEGFRVLSYLEMPYQRSLNYHCVDTHEMVDGQPQPQPQPQHQHTVNHVNESHDIQNIHLKQKSDAIEMEQEIECAKNFPILPNRIYPSDHIALVCDLQLFPTKAQTQALLNALENGHKNAVEQ